MKTVVFISNFMGNGGAARVIAVLAEEMRKQGNKVVVASFVADGYKYTLSSDIEQITLKIDANVHGIKRKVQRICAIRNLLKKYKGASVIAFEYFVNMESIVAAFGLECDLIVSERNDPAQEDKKRGIKQIRNFLYSFANVLVCQTPDAKAYFPENIQKKAVIIPNPIMGDLPPSCVGVRKKRIVNFCRIEKQKNLPLLIDAFELFEKSHSGYQLYIYGNGAEKENISEYISKKKLDKVAFVHDAIANIHEEVKDYMMFVSSSDYEGLSNSMLEAMAIGLPVICTDCPCGGARMVIRDGKNGLLVPCNDKQALVNAIIKIADDKLLRDTISHASLEIKEELSVTAIVKKWNEIINRI